MRGSWGAKVGMGESRLMNFNDAYRHVIGRRAASPLARLHPCGTSFRVPPPSPCLQRSKGGEGVLEQVSTVRSKGFDSRVIEISIRRV